MSIHTSFAAAAATGTTSGGAGKEEEIFTLVCATKFDAELLIQLGAIELVTGLKMQLKRETDLDSNITSKALFSGVSRDIFVIW
jgi:hypothetical protein